MIEVKLLGVVTKYPEQIKRRTSIEVSFPFEVDNISFVGVEIVPKGNRERLDYLIESISPNVRVAIKTNVFPNYDLSRDVHIVSISDMRVLPSIKKEVYSVNNFVVTKKVLNTGLLPFGNEVKDSHKPRVITDIYPKGSIESERPF